MDTRKGTAMIERQRVKTALFSVTDKSGIVELASDLVSLGVKIISTGGTARKLQEAHIPVTLVEEVTKFPEMLNGRVKTLHPMVHAGILARRDMPEHMQVIAALGIAAVDLVVVNLYAFDKKPGIEEIDIGGPTLLRAAAKNAISVAAVLDPSDYPEVARQIREHGGVSDWMRARLMQKVFHATSQYDAMIADWALKHIAAKDYSFLDAPIAGH